MTLNCEEKSAHSKATTLLALLMSQCSSLVVAQLLNTRAGISCLQIIKAAWGVMVPREGRAGSERGRERSSSSYRM